MAVARSSLGPWGPLLLWFATGLVPNAMASSGPCDGRNLIAEASWAEETLHGERLTDGVIAPEGDPWRTNRTSLVLDRRGIMVELAEARPITRIRWQGVSASGFELSTRRGDGPWVERTRTAPPPNSGLLTYEVALDGDTSGTRFIRLRAIDGGGALVLSELAAHCGDPPALRREAGIQDSPVFGARLRYRWDLAGLDLTLLLLGLVAFLPWLRCAWPASNPSRLTWGFLVLIVLSSLVSGLFFFAMRGWGLESALQLSCLGCAIWLGARAFRRAPGPPPVPEVWASAATASHAVGFTILHGHEILGHSAALFALCLPAVATLAAVTILARDRRGAIAAAALVLAGTLAGSSYGTFMGWRTVVRGWDATAVRVRGFDAGPVILHDQFHYYLGAKYARELQYDGLYPCTLAAREELGQGAVMMRQPIRDLQSNRLVKGAHLRAAARRCKERFELHRWRAFVGDVDHFFRSASPEATARYVTDHGYNATPVWTALHAPLTFTSATESTLTWLTLLDALLLATIAVLLTWAFGPIAAAPTLFLWGVGATWYYTHVGGLGSLGRFWWLAGCIAALCLLRRGRELSAGAALALATGVRLFPLFLAFGPAVHAGRELWRRRRLSPASQRLAAGFLVGSLLLGGGSVLWLGGFEHHRAFATNLRKHAATPLTNYIGLEVLVDWSLTDSLHNAFQREAPDPVEHWREQRRQRARARLPWRLGLALGLVLLAGWAATRDQPPWQRLVWGILPLFALTNLTNYYYAILLCLVPMVLRHPPLLLGLVGLTAMGQWTFLLSTIAMDDVTYALQSLWVLTFLLFAVFVVFRSGSEEGRGASASSPGI